MIPCIADHVFHELKWLLYLNLATEQDLLCSDNVPNIFIVQYNDNI